MANELINYANIKSKNGGGSSWKCSNEWTDTSVTIYFTAMSFVLQTKVSSVLFRSNWVDLTAYYWNGSSWVQAYAPRGNNGHTVYKSGAGDQTLKFYHNRSTEGTTSGDQPLYQMWKIVVSMRGKDGSAHGYFQVWGGGVEMMTETEYNNVCRGKPIKYIYNYLDFNEATAMSNSPSANAGREITADHVGYSLA